MTAADRQLPLVAHVIHRLGTGGLENGLVNIINRTPPGRYRHAIVCLTDAERFAERLRGEVPVLTLDRPPGRGVAWYGRLWAALIRLRPSVVHTRNLSALEGQIPALFVPGAKRVHGEHGRDVFDLDGKSWKYNLLRRAIRPLVQRYVAVSQDLEGWLTGTLGVAPRRIAQIYNGVDTDQFHPASPTMAPQGAPEGAPAGFFGPGAFVVGTVGRLAEVKDQATLVRGLAAATRSPFGDRLRLVIVGDGPLREQVARAVDEEGVQGRVWLAGERDDIPALLRAMHLFVLPSLAEGISNTLLEAMATGLPVVATRVGGNPELVTEGENGRLIPSRDPAALATAILDYAADPARASRQGAAGLARVRSTFGWDRCVAQYLAVYDRLLGMTD